MTILGMLGFAVGCIGMSRSEFLALTPEEFGEVARMWRQQEDVRFRTGWEQARFTALCFLSPYSKRKLEPADIIRFSWEKEEGKKQATSVATREDFERLKRSYGG